MATKIVIIGAGPAGVSVVESLRAHDKQSHIVVLSSEPHPPYSPPAMIDHFITGSRAHLWRSNDWPDKMSIEYHSGFTVKAVDPEIQQVQLENGENLAYDQLVIASGSRLYAPLPGAELPGVYNFKSLSAAEELVEKVKSGQARSAIIVGAGFIGIEIALLLRHLGVDVIQIEMLDQVMNAMLDTQTADFVVDIMRQRGIHVHLNTKATRFTGNGQATGVQLENGDILEADILIAATGVRPNLDFIKGSGIAHQWGIAVDDHLRTSIPNVFAAGDVVEAADRLTGETYVHPIFPNAVEQGRLVGLNLAGFDVPYLGAERMNSLKHLDLPIMAAGLKEGDEVLTCKVNGNQRTIYLQENRLVGYQLVGDIRPAGAFRSLMNRNQDIRKIKDHLLEATFGQGSLVWGAITAR